MAACGNDFSDLDAYMAEVRSRPKGLIDPVPSYPPMQLFAYQAMSLRSPFTAHVEVKQVQQLVASTNVKPDENRAKEFLEGFAFESLRMVGTIFKSGILWALVDDGAGSVHRVANGNYLGRNHGKVVSVGDSQIDVVEIVPNGAGAWLERPRSLSM
jgi:type IV pilus assembly protein PilP